MQAIQIDELLDHLPTLSTDYNRLLRHIRFLSQKLQLVSQNLEKLQSAYIQTLRNNKEQKNINQNPLGNSQMTPQEMLAKIKDLQIEGKALNSEKLACVSQLEESLQCTIGKLDQFINQTAIENPAIANEQDQTSFSQSNTEAQYQKLMPPGQKKKTVTRFIQKQRQQQQTQQQQREVISDNKTEHYCYCNGISYGQMLACDNPYCEREWFHYECIGITQTPKGKWYCSDYDQFRKLGVFGKEKKNKARKNYVGY